MTFICDTRAPGGIYLSDRAKRLLINKIIIDEEFQVEYIKINENKMTVQNVPHENVNILGLKFLSNFGFHLKNKSFELFQLPDYL